jgi:hypothetical protein
MFKHLYSFLLLIPGYFPVQANVIANTSAPSFIRIADVNDQKSKSHLLYADGAEEIIELILQTIGLQGSFEVKRASVPNAAAVVYRGKRYILYNPSFIAAMNKAAGTSWASVAVLAHEIGHHLNGHTLDGNGSLPAIELEADEFSGFVLRKMGASLEEAQLAMRIIATARATKTHPARNDRLMAIADGWNRADGQMGGRDIASKPSVPNTESSRDISVLSEENIAYDVHFTFDPKARYHVTIRNNLVKLLNNQLQVLGKLLATGKPSFPLAFQTGSKNFLLISNKGQIFNEEGKSLGYIIARK